MKIQRSGPGLEHLQKVLAELKSKAAEVGIPETAHYQDGTPVALVAAVHEFGHPEGGIPARPFFRPTVAARRQAWAEQIAQGAKAVLRGNITTGAMLEAVGLGAAGDIRKTVSELQDPPLSEATIKGRARKAKKSVDAVSRKPLVETRELITSIDSRVIDV